MSKNKNLSFIWHRQEVDVDLSDINTSGRQRYFIPVPGSVSREYDVFESLSFTALYLNFAQLNIDDKKEIIDFCSKYGTLGTKQSRIYSDYYKSLKAEHSYWKGQNDLVSQLTQIYEEDRHETLPPSFMEVVEDFQQKVNEKMEEINPDIYDSEYDSYEEFAIEKLRLVNIITLMNGIKRRDWPPVHRALLWLSKIPFYPAQEYPDEAWIKDGEEGINRLFSFAAEELAKQLNMQLIDVAQIANWDFNVEEISNIKHPRVTIIGQPRTLLAYIYWQMCSDLANQQEIRFCANPLCGEVFAVSSSSSSKRYCSLTCGNADRQRLYRQGKKKGKSEGTGTSE